MQPGERLQAIWTTLFGVSGSNGMRGQMLEHDRRLADLDRRMTEHERLRLKIEMIAITIQWIVLGVGGTIAFVLSTPVASVLAGWLRSALGPA